MAPLWSPTISSACKKTVTVSLWEERPKQQPWSQGPEPAHPAPEPCSALKHWGPLPMDYSIAELGLCLLLGIVSKLLLVGKLQPAELPMH